MGKDEEQSGRDLRPRVGDGPDGLVGRSGSLGELGTHFHHVDRLDNGSRHHPCCPAVQEGERAFDDGV